MSKFKVGEIAIICSVDFPEYNGTETEILGVFHSGTSSNGVGYRCTIQKRGWSESALRKKKPPEEKTTWEEIQEITNWNPSKAVVK